VGTGICLFQFLLFFVLVVTCVTLSWPHSCFQSTLNCSIISYREWLCCFQSMKELYCTLEDADDEESVIAPSSFVHKPPNGLSTPRLPLDSSSDTATDKRYHAGLELAQCKAKLRRLRHELSVHYCRSKMYAFIVLVVKNQNSGQRKRADLHQQRSGGEWGVCILYIVREVWNWHCSCIFKDHRCNLKQVTAGSIPQPHQRTPCILW